MKVEQRITTVVLLAAGTGSRLRPLTLDAPKCLTMIKGKPILQHLLDTFRIQGIKKIIVATGYLEHRIREYLEQHASDMVIEYIFNANYQTTNNIYSLWLTRQVIQEDFILMESDLVFDSSLLDDMMYPNRIAVSNILPWMNGTTVSLDNNHKVNIFHMSANVLNNPHYKTVNICSLSLGSWYKVLDRLDNYISAKNLNTYYEAVFADLVANKTLSFEAIMFDEKKWYEIDTIEDLEAAEKLFSR
ncbi:Phosphocholine cytidylyltransferase (EC 2.7.7.15) / Aspartate aminotransferase (EC 2.6.1.1) [uncultured Gammaproteobacteria bacterium]|uniref:phosphocholine cytidylyltransferase family protein n=1 Tax=Bathymodiolus heckerae thiotrophic gill symbiont TaxID=1052212 RepID=UPI0010BA0190|nr:phosphocholine cytidylyltransferase family protein [Bathymodiolus heckerae thiotrophic gill symbiont]CAC9457126.1 Phosphocholine cytidylyltransferase (EC 2.7.7.15) / Aspartate aminotransferase (EC 2.6.1.1) [uncultured Gammaproteobacteria bacterium]SMN12906.1 Phosphocholine cytidylyltransferase / Aspartate aminotransferase [Bathymodiolus heckerae thiotrophic gill symbiont]